MEVKEFLQQYHIADREISAKLLQICRLREIAAKTTRTITADRVQGSKENRLEAAVQKIVDLERDIQSDVVALAKARHRIEDAVNLMSDPVLKEVLRLRYINGMTFEHIADEMNYSCRNVFYLHKKAVNEIGKYLRGFDNRTIKLIQ